MDSEKRDQAVTSVPYIVFESVQARNERHIKRLWITSLVLVALLFLSNALWLRFYSEFDFESYEYEQDGSGINIVGDDNKEVKQYGTESENTQNDQTDGSTRQNKAGESENG